MHYKLQNIAIFYLLTFNVMLTVNFDQLKEYFSGRDDIICAIIFGSAQNGFVRDGSDLDIGIYFIEKPKGDDYIKFMVEVAEAAEFDVIDLVDLSNADPILAFEVLSGHFICKNDPYKTAELTSLICREYEDIMFRLNSAA